MTTNMGMGGTIRKSSDGELLGEGDNIRVFSMHIVSDTTGGVVSLIEGGSSGTTKVSEIGTASTGKTFNYGNGVLFTNGCYADIDANTTSIEVQAIKEL